MDVIDLLDAPFIEFKSLVRLEKPGLYVFGLSDGSNFIARAIQDHGAGCGDCRFDNELGGCELARKRGGFLCDVTF